MQRTAGAVGVVGMAIGCDDLRYLDGLCSLIRRENLATSTRAHGRCVCDQSCTLACAAVDASGKLDFSLCVFCRKNPKRVITVTLVTLFIVTYILRDCNVPCNAGLMLPHTMGVP